MASSDEDEHQSNAGQKFSKDVLAVLDQFYVGGIPNDWLGDGSLSRH